MAVSYDIRIVHYIEEFSQLVGPDRGVAHEDSVFLFAVGQGDCNIQPAFQFAVFIFEIGADVQRTGRQVDVGREVVECPGITLPSVLSEAYGNMGRHLDVRIVLVGNHFHPHELVVFDIEVGVHDVVFV